MTLGYEIQGEILEFDEVYCTVNSFSSVHGNLVPFSVNGRQEKVLITAIIMERLMPTLVVTNRAPKLGTECTMASFSGKLSAEGKRKLG